MVCVIIPLYKSFKSLSSEELGSIRQCLQILTKYPIYFIGPHHLDFEEYVKLGSDLRVDFKIIKFDSRYFKSIEGYNRLLLSLLFYKTFKKHAFMLIYQTDCWVFRDDLMKWCKKGYDYIGAPWFEGWGKSEGSPEIIGVGNGGFSLRNIQAHLRVLHSFSNVYPIDQIWNRYMERKGNLAFKIVMVLKFLVNITFKNNTFFLLNQYPGHEDGFWGYLARRNFSWFKVASDIDAVSFCFELHPLRSFELNNFQLPFGCHAWQRYEPEFWKSYISIPSE